MDKTLSVLKALSDGTRLRIVNALMRIDEPELCACQLVELTGLTGATISRHMGILIRSGLVDSRKEGKWVFYSILRSTDTEVLLHWVTQKMESSPEMKQDLKRLKSISKKQLCGINQGREGH